MAGASQAGPELAELNRQLDTRTDVERLPVHLEERYSVEVSGLHELGPPAGGQGRLAAGRRSGACPADLALRAGRPGWLTGRLS
jgi:hypothetical protein